MECVCNCIDYLLLLLLYYSITNGLMMGLKSMSLILLFLFAVINVDAVNEKINI